MLYPTLWRGTPSLFADDLFSAGWVFERTSFRPVNGGNQAWMPPVDVCEASDAYQVFSEVPGMSPDDIEVTAQCDLLIVRGEKRYELRRARSREATRCGSVASDVSSAASVCRKG